MRTNRFVDALGTPVAVGDMVRAVGVNEARIPMAEVIDLIPDPDWKPFKVRIVHTGEVCFMNPEWTLKLDEHTPALKPGALIPLPINYTGPELQQYIAGDWRTIAIPQTLQEAMQTASAAGDGLYWYCSDTLGFAIAVESGTATIC